MGSRPKKNAEMTSKLVLSRLKNFLKSGCTFHQTSRGTGSAARLLVTQLEDRLTPTTLHWLGSSAATGANAIDATIDDEKVTSTAPSIKVT